MVTNREVQASVICHLTHFFFLRTVYFMPGPCNNTEALSPWLAPAGAKALKGRAGAESEPSADLAPLVRRLSNTLPPLTTSLSPISHPFYDLNSRLPLPSPFLVLGATTDKTEGKNFASFPSPFRFPHQSCFRRGFFGSTVLQNLNRRVRRETLFCPSTNLRSPIGRFRTRHKIHFPRRLFDRLD